MMKNFTMIYSCFSLFLTNLWIGCVSCAVYHIISSLNHDCPVKSCLTLSSFAANASLYLESNTSLIFQLGNHTIHSKLNVTGVVDFSMISDQSRAGITCENDSEPGFIFNAVNHVHVSNLKFFECYCHMNYSFDRGIKLMTLTAKQFGISKVPV